MEDNKVEKTEVDKFFEDLPSEDKKPADIFETEIPKETPKETPKEEPKEDIEEVRKNRRHRRLEDALQKERESNIALNERIKVLAEIDKVEPTGDMPAEWVALLGDSPEAQKAWKLQQNLLNKQVEQAKVSLKQELIAEQERLAEEQKQYETEIDTELELIEETYGVDLTSNSPKARKERTEFLEMIEKLSPKDKDGDILQFADFESTYEIYRQTKAKEKSPLTEKQKELGSRAMQSSSQGGGEAPKRTPGFRGWMKDMNL